LERGEAFIPLLAKEELGRVIPVGLLMYFSNLGFIIWNGCKIGFSSWKK